MIYVFVSPGTQLMFGVRENFLYTNFLGFFNSRKNAGHFFKSNFTPEKIKKIFWTKFETRKNSKTQFQSKKKVSKFFELNLRSEKNLNSKSYQKTF